MPRVVHFELSADDPERAIKFYSRVFGWEFEKWAGPQAYWLITTGPDDQPGINGGLLPRRGNMHCVNTLEVASVDEAIAKVTAAGGRVAVPKSAIIGVGWLAYCVDPEGNIFGVMHRDASAR